MNAFKWHLYLMSVGLRTRRNRYVSASQLLQQNGLTKDQRITLLQLRANSGYVDCWACEHPVKAEGATRLAGHAIHVACRRKWLRAA